MTLRRHRAQRGDEGLTLIELLIVLVVLPLIIGGVAEALIVSFNTESSNSNRISDTLSAQVSQAFFVRDVQGASYITTSDNSVAGTGYSRPSPEVCSPGTQTVTAMTNSGKTVTATVASTSQLAVGQGVVIAGAAGLSNVNGTWTISAIPSSTTFKFVVTSTPSGAYTASSATASEGNLLVALYHPAESSGTALDVAYWHIGAGSASEIDRYSCTLNSSFAYTSAPTKTVMASGLEGNSLIHTLQTMTAVAHIDPPQFAGAAGLGWTLVAASTTASGYSTVAATCSALGVSQPCLSVGSTAGFGLGTTASGGSCAPAPALTSASGCSGAVITVTTTQGPVQLTCTAFTLSAFGSCTGTVSGSVVNNSGVTQSNVSAVQIGVTEPASSYHFSLAAAPRPAEPQAASQGSNGPTLLTLGTTGINPVNGGGGVACPDGTTANICIGNSGVTGSVVVDSDGALVCSGGGVHNYIHFQGGSGTVYTVSSSSSSSCNTTNNGNNVQVVGSSSGQPDPIAANLPNNGCMPASIVASAALLTNPPQVGGNNVPGIYTTALSGTLEPGLYIVENGIGNITGMAPDSGTNLPFYKVNGTNDPNAGALLFVPPVQGKYLPGQGCYSYNTAAAISGTVNGLVPMDATQSGAYFGGNQSLGGVWFWQDVTDTQDVAVVGYAQGGLFYAPGANYNPPSPPGSLATGSMIIAGVTGNGTHLGLCLNWPPYTTC